MGGCRPGSPRHLDHGEQRVGPPRAWPRRYRAPKHGLGRDEPAQVCGATRGEMITWIFPALHGADGSEQPYSTAGPHPEPVFGLTPELQALDTCTLSTRHEKPLVCSASVIRSAPRVARRTHWAGSSRPSPLLPVLAVPIAATPSVGLRACSPWSRCRRGSRRHPRHRQVGRHQRRRARRQIIATKRPSSATRCGPGARRRRGRPRQTVPRLRHRPDLLRTDRTCDRGPVDVDSRPRRVPQELRVSWRRPRGSSQFQWSATVRDDRKPTGCRTWVVDVGIVHGDRARTAC